MHFSPTRSSWPLWVLAAAFVVATAVYWPGLHGGFLFDDYPNIVDNPAVQPHDASVPSLVRAALSSPSSEFKRPLASLSFAANYLATGLDPYWMKLTNLVIHLLNGGLVFLLARALLKASIVVRGDAPAIWSRGSENEPSTSPIGFALATPGHDRAGIIAALTAGAWLLLPINLTSVLYVVQRMESLANLFVLLGLLGYVGGRQRMLAGRYVGGLSLCAASLIAPTVIGMLAKETTVMLPMYAFLIEWALFRFSTGTATRARNDRGVWLLFGLVLFLPMIVGLAWMVPQAFSPTAFSGRDFTLVERLLSEARIVVGYIGWTLVPTPHALSFYHDDYPVSQSLLAPWTTLGSIIVLALLLTTTVVLRKRAPLIALGLALFLATHLLTGTILPLELVYEHRNYFASFGLLLALVPALAARASTPERTATETSGQPKPLPFALPRHALLTGLFVFWIGLTASTSQAWGNPLRLAEELAARAPKSPRAQYELGRTYIIYSHYDPASPFTKLAYAPLERAAALPNGSILPEQALIFMNARMHLPLRDAWWESLVGKLEARRPGVQDESSLEALTQCAREHRCDLPKGRMVDAFIAALKHPHPSARLLAIYGDYGWNVLEDRALGERMTEEAVRASPGEPAYRITLIRMLAAEGHTEAAKRALAQLESLNTGGRLNGSLAELHALPGLR